MKVPRGFLFNGISVGIKKRGKDLGIVVTERDALAIGYFTTNEFKSESLLVCKEHIRGGKAKALVVNSGNANCATGKRGIKIAKDITKSCARVLRTKGTKVLIASTGKIGYPLPWEKILPNIKRLVGGCSHGKVLDFAQAIMTTDTKPKYSFKELKSGVRILVVAKGAGMIEPDLATTLCFLFTDAQIKKGTFKVILKRALNLSFNRISVDGEQSTNDTFIALANGASGIDVEQDKGMLAEFEEAVFSLLSELSYKVVEDGEGATKVIRIDVVGAKDERSARVIAKRLASSMLLKASLFGSCANWGRILSAIGSLKLGIGRALDVYYGDIQVVKDGVSLHIRKKEADRYLRRNKFVSIKVKLKGGDASYYIYTTDLSPKYVEMNR